LHDGEAPYHKLFETMDEAYAVVEVLKDDAGRWADFLFLEVNRAFMEHTSMPWPVGKTARQLLGEPNPRWAQLYGQALDTGLPLRVEEEEPVLKRIFDLNIFALDRARHRVAVLFTDITARKRADALLRESEARYRLLLGSLAQAMWETDADGVVVTDSPSWRAYTGQALHELLGYGWLDAIHPDDRAYAERQWR
jgi:PAS domain-containing protein